MFVRRALVSALLVVGGLVAASDADAALTVSEKAQLRDFIASARIENAPRARTLVARTDHTEADAIAAMAEALAPVPFTEPRAAFVKEVLFGNASAASRPLLAVLAVRGLLARADAVYQKNGGGLERDPRAVSELVALYAFLDSEIANAGKPTSTAHDATAGIPAASYESASRALRDHVEQNARWLKGDGAVPEPVGRVRAQAQVLLVDMLPDGLTRRVDAADRLGLKGARRQMLSDWGILLADAGKLDDAKAERVRQALGRLPGARADLALLYAGDDRGPLRARGLVAFVGAPGADAYPFTNEVTAGPHDPAVSAIVLDLSVLAAKKALESRADFRAQVERDAIAAQGDATKLLGRPRAPALDHVLGSAVHVLMIDAPRAIDLALVRVLDAHPESTTLLSDAMGALAASATPDKGGQIASLELGKPGGTTTATAVRVAPNGVVTGFTIDGHAWTFERSAPTFALTSVRRDGQNVALAHLPLARAPMREAAKPRPAGDRR